MHLSDHAVKEQLICNIASALSSARVAGEQAERWQPIETAPKTDDDVMLFLSDGDIVIGYWRDDANAFDSDAGWVPRPTHWMPLPSPPIDPPKET